MAALTLTLGYCDDFVAVCCSSACATCGTHDTGPAGAVQGTACHCGVSHPSEANLCVPVFQRVMHVADDALAIGQRSLPLVLLYMLLVAVPVLFAAVVAAVVVVYPLFPSEPRAHDSCRQLQLSLMHAWSRVVGQVLWNLVGIPEKGAAALAGIPHVLAALKRHMDCEAVVLPALTTLANALNLPGQADHLLEELPVFMLGLEKYFDNRMVNQPLLLLSLLPRFLVCLTGLRAIVGRSRDCRACGPPPPSLLVLHSSVHRSYV